MSLHHIPGVEETLQEVRRVLAPGGLLVVREHDLSYAALAVLLDVMHGLYARVWSEPAEQPHFCADYYARYRGRGEWTRMMEEAGLRQCEGSDDRRAQPWDGGVKVRRDSREGEGEFIRNPFQFYYGLYTKPLDDPGTAPAPAQQQASGGQKRSREEADEQKDGEAIKRAALSPAIPPPSAG